MSTILEAFERQIVLSHYNHFPARVQGRLWRNYEAIAAPGPECRWTAAHIRQHRSKCGHATHIDDLIAAVETSWRARPEVMQARRRFLLGVPMACGCGERGGIVFFAAVLLRPATRRARFRQVGEIAVCSRTL